MEDLKDIVTPNTASSPNTDTGIERGDIREIKNIEKSPFDPYSYKMVILPNQIRTLIIQDPSATRSAAALSVAVGSLADPPQFRGLAHFLEHMVFMGSEKYPQAADFDNFLSKHGGSSNAYTCASETNYQFDVSNSEFLNALDQFAQFFICPLFLKKYVDKEINAVHSESEASRNSDSSRVWYLNKLMSKKGHLHSQYQCGNLSTLKKEGLYEALQ